jgi:glutathione S-transferase
MNKVPALVHHHGDHDHVITECAAINHYLAEAHPEAGLLPDTHERAAYFRWLFFAAGPLEQAIMARMMGWELAEGKDSTAGFGTLERTLDALDGWLSAHDFAAGSRFTMADTYVGSQFVWGLRFGSIPERPSFKAYVERITQRPAYAQANAIDAAIIKAPQG